MAFFPCSQASYEALFNTLVPADYACSLRDENQGSGYDWVAAYASIFERFENAANTSQQSYFLKPHSIQTGEPASSAAKAFGTVEIARTLQPTIGTLQWEARLPVGTVLTAFYRPDSTGQDLLIGTYETTEELVLAEGDPGPVSVAAECVFPGYAGNLSDGLIDSFAVRGAATVPSTITVVNQVTETGVPGVTSDLFQRDFQNRYLLLTTPAPNPPLTGPTRSVPRRITQVLSDRVVLFDPPVDAADVGKFVVAEVVELGDIGLTVSQPDPFEGGKDDSLAAIGTNRNRGRIPGETDKQYCDRLQALDDIVSPAALQRVAQRVLDPFGITFSIKETRDPNGLGGFIWDLHPFDFGGLTPISKPLGSELVGQGQVYLDQGSYRRFFLVCIEDVQLGEFGMFYDKPTLPSTLPAAYDLPASIPLGGFYDGSAIGINSIAARLWDELNRTRAAGVGFAIVKA